ncbi:hypothetical protein NDN01_02410 [Sphingomonas sp. QA11]|uniref:hypothetical protein n=1 Tax=Sphingomonas sp. QA11 TaxID=2950605 RepID=UPI00234AAC93|nr:hypothetical protein [Sphingomonas sp. QA11]WCM27804.1 hypothetical protein NDN01_02410 [Sphingomonas sp. QA11]
MKRTLFELLHIAAGLVGTALLASAAAWGVPRSAGAIWDVAYVVMAVVAFMGIRPLRLAWRADQESKTGQPSANG